MACYVIILSYLNAKTHTDDIEPGYSDQYVIVAGDFNTLDCDLLEIQCGLVQLVNQPTHAGNILDKVFTNRDLLDILG